MMIIVEGSLQVERDDLMKGLSSPFFFLECSDQAEEPQAAVEGKQAAWLCPGVLCRGPGLAGNQQTVFSSSQRWLQQGQKGDNRGCLEGRA